MNDKALLEAFRSAAAGDVARLRDALDVRWRLRSLAVSGQTYRAEAFVTVPYPASHTLVIEGGLDVGEAPRDWRSLQRHPGDGPGRSESRIMIRDLPIFIGDLIWARPADPSQATTTVTARLTLRFELAGRDGMKVVEVPYEHRLEVTTVTAWPDDYPETVTPTFSDVPLQLSGRVGLDGQVWVDVDLLRPLDLGVAWEVQIQAADGSILKRVDWAVTPGLVQGISTPVTVPDELGSLVVVFSPSRRVARGEAGLERYADISTRREVAIAR